SGLVDATTSEPLPTLTIIQSSAVSRVQRRQNFRVKCLIPLELIASIRGSGDELTVIAAKTTTCDLSASGVALLYAKHIPEGTLMVVQLSLPDAGPSIKIPCRVAYSDTPSEKKTMYRIGIQYLVITESERARIVRYVYKTQLKGLRS